MNTKKFSFGDFLLAAIKCVGYYGVYFAVTMLAAIIFGSVIGLSGSVEDVEALVNENALTLTLLTNALFLLTVAIFYNSRFRNSSFGERVWVRPVNSKIVPYIFSLAICAILAVQIIDIIPFPNAWIEMLYDNSSIIVSGTAFMQILTVAVVSPVAEEVLFRGLMLGALSKTCNKWLAIIATSIVFGLVHGHPIGIIYATCLGVLMGWLFCKTGSIIAPALFHMIYNTASLFFPTPSTVLTVIIIVAIGFALGAVCVVNIARMPLPKQKPENKDDSEV